MSVAYDLSIDTDTGTDAPELSPRSRPLSLVPAQVPPSGVPTAPPSRRPGARPAAGSVTLLRTLDDPAPLRLTRRGVVVLAAVLAALGTVVLVLGALSARSSSAPHTSVGPAVVTVQAGDTLWSIASHAAPGRDPRAEIATIHQLNSLHGQALVPGQRLRVR